MQMIKSVDVEHMIKFDIEGKGEDTYFLNIEQEGKEIKGVFMVNSFERNVDPTLNVIV
jgi:hypothetical protein